MNTAACDKRSLLRLSLRADGILREPEFGKPKGEQVQGVCRSLEGTAEDGDGKATASQPAPPGRVSADYPVMLKAFLGKEGGRQG